jgi:type IV pilus assembly protein PilQ
MTQSITIYVVASTSTGAGTGLIGAPQLQSITASLNLDVLPIVANDGTLSLNVKVRNEVPSGNTPPISVNTRNVSTDILMDNGDTAVLGGIFQNTVTEAKQGIPWLMQIPILGFFFADNSLSSDRTETFIFLTAKILNPEEAFKRSF